MPSFTSGAALESYIKSKMSVALQNTASKLAVKLHEYIYEDFYTRYYPKEYQRTYQFQDSPEINMIAKDLVEIFVNTDRMNYEDATGEYVATLAASGYHGNTSIFCQGFFWEDFTNYVTANVKQIYKQEMQAVGLPVK